MPVSESPISGREGLTPTQEMRATQAHGKGSHQVPAAGLPGIGATDQQPISPPLYEGDIVLTVLCGVRRLLGGWESLAGPADTKTLSLRKEDIQKGR